MRYGNNLQSTLKVDCFETMFACLFHNTPFFAIFCVLDLFNLHTDRDMREQCIELAYSLSLSFPKCNRNTCLFHRKHRPSPAAAWQIWETDLHRLTRCWRSPGHFAKIDPGMQHFPFFDSACQVHAGGYGPLLGVKRCSVLSFDMKPLDWLDDF